MKKLLKNIIMIFDDNLLRLIVKWLYPQYKRQRKGYMKNYKVLSTYAFWQKIIGINRSVPWPVDFRSTIVDWKNIEKGIMCDPGDNPGIYINAGGGLKLGNNVNIGQNTVINTTNHYKYDHRKESWTKGVEIGNNVWIGANCSIVAGIKIGDNVTIGAGCVIRTNIPSDCTVVHGDEQIKIINKSKPYEWDCTKEELI